MHGCQMLMGFFIPIKVELPLIVLATSTYNTQIKGKLR
jgi:hypothetical protein